MDRTKRVRVLKFEPGKNPKTAYLYNNIDIVKKEVSEGAEYLCDELMVLKLEPRVYAVYNPEAPLMGLKANRKVENTIIAGTFFIVYSDGNDTICNIPVHILDKYGLKYWDAEEYSFKMLGDDFFRHYMDVCVAQ